MKTVQEEKSLAGQTLSPEDMELRESLNSLYKEEIKVFSARKNTLRQNQIKLWGIIWGQCSPALRIEVKGDKEYFGAQLQYNIVWLLTKLKLAAAGIDRSVSPYQALVNSITFFTHFANNAMKA